MNMLAEDTSVESRHVSPVLAIKFSIDDLPLVAHFLNLKKIQCCEQHNGSNNLYLFEQIAFLNSLTSVEPPALKRRRIRHQHFWRDSDKLAVDERVYVKSADVQLAMEEGVPVMPVSQLSQSEHTSTWTVCLTALGAKELLNRKISPLGDLQRLYVHADPVQPRVSKLLNMFWFASNCMRPLGAPCGEHFQT